jgi:NADPH:quinone reductase-like Zn-dependent oxidoreductase
MDGRTGASFDSDPLKRGGRLVTCGATSGPTVTFNLMQLFQQQYRIIGSFGALCECRKIERTRRASLVACGPSFR